MTWFKHNWVALIIIFIFSCLAVCVTVIVVKREAYLSFTTPSTELSQSWDFETPIHKFSISSDGRLVVITTEEISVGTVEAYRETITFDIPKPVVQLWNLDTHTLIYSWYEVNDAQFSTDENFIVTTSKQGITFWNINTGALEYKLGSNRYGRFAISPNGKMLAAASSDTQQIELWGLEDRELKQEIAVPGDIIRSIAFSPNNQFLALGRKRDVQIVQVSNGQVHNQLIGYDGSIGGGFYDAGRLIDNEIINSIAFSPDSSLLVAGTGIFIDFGDFDTWTADHTVRLWRVANAQPIYTFTEPRYGVETVAFNPDGTLVIGVGGKHNLYGPPKGSTTREQDTYIRLWSVKDGRLVIELKGHTDLITDVQFSSDGRWITTSSEDGTIKRWTIPNTE